MTRRDGAALALERERRFVMPPGVSLPPLDLLGPTSPARSLRLTATYFDTPGRDLARAGMTLRRRMGGEDDGWHLRTPRPGDAGLEHRLPIGTPCRVPASLRSTVAEVVGDHALLPVLRLRTRRRVTHVFAESGRIRLEVAVDEVAARVVEDRGSSQGRWSEVEVELAPGEPASTLDEVTALFLGAGLTASHASKAQHALGSGTPPPTQDRATAAAAVLSAVRRQFGRFQALETAIASDEPDAVHRGRVALRRMRSILTVFARTYRWKHTAALLAELRWAGALLGAPRDSEVLRDLIDDLVSDPAVSGSGAATVVRALDANLDSRHEAARAHLLGAMATPRWDAMHERVVALLLGAEATRAGRRAALPELRRLAARADARVARRWVRAASSAEDLTLWHSVRKAAKAARYAHEEVAALPGSHRPDENRAKKWEEVTTAFGLVQDLVVAQELLRVTPGGQSPLANLAARRLDDALAQATGLLTGVLRR